MSQDTNKKKILSPIQLSQLRIFAKAAPLSKKVPESIPLINEILDLLKNLDGLKLGIQESLKKIDAKTDAVYRKLLEDFSEKLEKIKSQKGDQGESGKDYILTQANKLEIASLVKIPSVEKIIEKTEVIRELPIISQTLREELSPENIAKIEQKIEFDLPKFGTSIRDALELLQDDERLDASAIKGLEEFFKKTKSNLIYVPVGSGNSTSTSGVGAWSTPAEIPATDGSVTQFTVGTSAPTDVIADGILYFSGQGYTYLSPTITFNIGGGGPTQYVRYR